MANRVIIGKRGSDYGLFASRSGIDVTDTSSTDHLSFDSSAATCLIVHSFCEGILTSFNDWWGGAQSISFGGVTYTSSQVTITHNLGYEPAFAVRWNRYIDLSSGVATAVYSPFSIQVEEEIDTGEEEEGGAVFEPTVGADGGCLATVSNTTLKIENTFRDYFATNSTTVNNSAAIYYAYVIFKEENFINGGSF